jgi:L-fuconolactonase
MKRIDTHQHFWKYNESDYVWMDDRMETLRRDYLPPDLEKEQQKAGFIGSIAVQARQMEVENDFLLTLADRYPRIMGVVGWVDLRSESVEERLAYYSRFPKFRGVRHVIHDEPEDDFMLRPGFLEGISRLKDFDLCYDILIFEKHLDNTIKFVSKFPDQKFVIDHMAKPLIRERILQPWSARIRELAEYGNVFCKISGMVAEADWNHWREEDFRPYLEIVTDAFGTGRLMVGSNWPVCRLAGEYSEVIGIVESFFPQEDKEHIFWQNAVEFYGLKI